MLYISTTDHVYQANANGWDRFTDKFGEGRVSGSQYFANAPRVGKLKNYPSIKDYKISWPPKKLLTIPLQEPPKTEHNFKRPSITKIPDRQNFQEEEDPLKKVYGNDEDDPLYAVSLFSNHSVKYNTESFYNLWRGKVRQAREDASDFSKKGYNYIEVNISLGDLSLQSDPIRNSIRTTFNGSRTIFESNWFNIVNRTNPFIGIRFYKYSR